MEQTRTVGRPRSFDKQTALDAAMKVFWRKGYEGASLSDLTKAMRINRPSLYAAFGDKENLFRKVLARYTQGPVGYVEEALEESTARQVAERLLLGTAEMLGNPRNPRGCLGVQGALVCGEGSASIRRELALFRRNGEKRIRERFERAKREGDLAAGADPADLASYITTVIRGMSVDAASGASLDGLRRVAQTAMRAWPK